MTQSNGNSPKYDNISTKYDEYILQEDENRLDYLKTLLNKAMLSDNYEKAVELAEKIASIYRRQDNASEGGRFEHEAFLFTQRKIYRDAGIPVNMFSGIPYAEKLKDAMTEAAELAMEQKQIDYYVCYKKMIARICRAQGKEGDAYMLDCSISSLLEPVKNILKYKEITDADLEKQCLNSIAVKCSADLYTG